MNSRDRLQPKFPAWVESRVAISGRSATAWVFAATSACFRVVIFNRFMSAIGESCRYAPAKGRKMPDRLPDAQRSQRFGSARTSDEHNSGIERAGRLCSLQAGTLAGPGGAGVQDLQGFEAAAALVVNGVVVAAAAEERFNRHKQSGDFPVRAIDLMSSGG